MKIFVIFIVILAILLNVVEIIQISNGTIEPTATRTISNDIVIIMFDIGLAVYWINKEE